MSSGGAVRPRLDIGALGEVTFSDLPSGKVKGRGYTRDASGKGRRVTATGDSTEAVYNALSDKAKALGIAQADVTTSTSLAGLLDTWFDEIVSTRNIREQTKTMYRTKANKLSKLYGGITVESLRPARVQSIINDLATRTTKNEGLLHG